MTEERGRVDPLEEQWVPRFHALPVGTLLLSAFTVVLVLMADGAGRLELALKVLFDSGSSVSRRPHHDLYVPFVEDLHRSPSHAPADYDVDASIGEKVG